MIFSTLNMCLAPGCPTSPSLLILKNGARYMDMGGALIRHQCFQGYMLNGPPVSYCDGRGWNATFPECVGDPSYVASKPIPIPPRQGPIIADSSDAIPPLSVDSLSPPKPRKSIFVDEKDSNYNYYRGLIESGKTNSGLVRIPLHGDPNQENPYQPPPNPNTPFIPNGPQFMGRKPQFSFSRPNPNMPNFGWQNQRGQGIPNPNNPNGQVSNQAGQPLNNNRQIVPPFNPYLTSRYPQRFMPRYPPQFYYPPNQPRKPQQPGYFPPRPPYGYPPNFMRPQNPIIQSNNQNITGQNTTHTRQQVVNQRIIRGQAHLVNQFIARPQVGTSWTSVNGTIESGGDVDNITYETQTTFPPPLRDQFPISETKLAGSQEVRVDCPPPPRILRGYTITKPLPRDFPDDDYLYFIEYHCLPGYSLIGSNNSYCLKTGKWSGIVPSCKKDEPKISRPPGTKLCAAGFEWKAEKCKDIDECESENGGCEQKCINFMGGFYCQCSSGYELNEDKMTCADVDECDLEDKCGQSCINSVGSYECICRDGYYLFQQDNRTCLDVNECLTTAADTCSQICINTFGSFECACGEEYTLIEDGVSCVQNCPLGFMMNDEQECVDRDECLETGSCEQMCTNTIGTFICSCQEGHYLTENQIFCQDVDECENNDHNCKEECRNLPGGFECVCFEHKIEAEDGVCVECPSGLFKSLIQNKCVSCPANSSLISSNESTRTLADCRCFRGYKGNPEQEIPCVDNDECEDDNFGCSHVCTNTLGSAFCGCPAGYRLENDQRTCQDINECLNHNGGCEVNCHNFDGGYRCSCNNEDRLLGDGKRCTKVQGHCNALPPMVNGRILPNFACVQQQYPPRERVCLFICNHGFKLVGPRRRKCLENGWSGEETKCVLEDGCPPVSINNEMLVLPALCATQNSKHNQVCRFQCKQSGYHIDGHLSTMCNENEWSNSVPTCSNDVSSIEPIINCPANLTVDLPTGSAEVAVDIPQPSTNMVLVEKSFIGRNSSSTFPFGKTIVKFTAFTNDRSREASCNVAVQVNDYEQPMIQRCPGGFIHETEEMFPEVSWQLPLFSDNVGVAQVRWSRNPDGNITYGTYSVTYIASDAAENTAECSFTFKVRRKMIAGQDPHDCHPPKNPPNAKLNCKKWARGFFCIPKCNSGFAFTSQPPSYICDQGKWSWTPKKKAPNCVDTRASRRQSARFSTTTQLAVVATTSQQDVAPTITTQAITTRKHIAQLSVNGIIKCPRGQVPQTGPRGDRVCVECPSGTYRPRVAAINSCIPCPPGYYQESNGMGSCEQCPDYNKNRHAYRQRQIAGRSRGFVSQEECEILRGSSTSTGDISDRRITLINSLRSLRLRRVPP